MSTYRFSATVNGQRRSTGAFSAPDGLSARQIETDYFDNNEENYRSFYADATEADYDAELVDVRVERWGWAEVE